jgi:RNA polymerase sigma-70 factor, ECF subfamily
MGGGNDPMDTETESPQATSIALNRPSFAMNAQPSSPQFNVESEWAANGGPPPASGPAVQARPLKDQLVSVEEAFELGRAAWPMLAAKADLFWRYVEELGFKNGLSAARAQDLYLVHACLEKTPGAMEAFEGAHLPTIESAARTVDAPTTFVDEVKQRLREILFLPKEGLRPRIAQYSGHGPLAGWVATTTRRIAFRLARTNGTRKFVGEEALACEFCKGGDPDLIFLKAQYKVAFNEAIIKALRKLPRRERLILRLNLVQGVSMDRIAKMHNVSQPTVSRWLQRARLQILKTIRDVVRDELSVHDREFDSILYLVRSQIDVSFSRLLGETNDYL